MDFWLVGVEEYFSEHQHYLLGVRLNFFLDNYFWVDEAYWHWIYIEPWTRGKNGMQEKLVQV